MRILIDASSAILLYKAGVLDNVLDAYEVWMSGAVFKEVDKEDRPGARAFREAIRTHRITVGPERAESAFAAAPSLGEGERETLIQFLSDGDRFRFIETDDGDAARLCRSMGLPFVNALLMVRLLRWAGHLPREKSASAWATLQTIGRYSTEIIQKAETISPDHLLAFYSSAPP